MTAHIVFPPTDSLPGTISKKVMTGLLRGELGFDGLAGSDGLEMRAIAGGVGIGEGTGLALAAGWEPVCVGAGLARGGTRPEHLGGHGPRGWDGPVRWESR